MSRAGVIPCLPLCPVPGHSLQQTLHSSMLNEFWCLVPSGIEFQHFHLL